MRIYRALSAAVLTGMITLSGCGDSSDEAAPAGSAVNRELAEEGIDFDASTMDAMSVDVVAGGNPTSVDPGTADAGIDMLSAARERAGETADRTAAETQE